MRPSRKQLISEAVSRTTAAIPPSSEAKFSLSKMSRRARGDRQDKQVIKRKHERMNFLLVVRVLAC